jgi:hypothetical protein
MDFLKNARCKKDVCKDVVIWAEPKMTVWDSDFEFKPCREPLSVMLWKVINQATASLSKLSSRPST